MVQYKTLPPPQFLLHHSNTSSSGVYATNSLAFSVLLLLKVENFEGKLGTVTVKLKLSVTVTLHLSKVYLR